MDEKLYTSLPAWKVTRNWENSFKKIRDVFKKISIYNFNFIFQITDGVHAKNLTATLPFLDFSE